MNNMDYLESAGEWLQKLHSAPQDESVLNDWLQWYEADPQNAAAFDRLQGTWDAFDAPGLRTQLVSAARKPNRHILAMAIAASLLIAVALVVATSMSRQSEVLVTQVAEESKRVLADGSRISLGASTRVTTRYSQRERSVRVDDGEAYFQVKKEVGRPFIVRAGSLQVTALGTAFTVKRTPARTTVTVSEGLVQVTPDGAYGSPTNDVRATVGEQIVLLEGSNHFTVSRVDPAGAWPFQDGVLRFVDQPLKDVIDEVNRFSAHRIVLPDASLQDELYTGTVYEDRIDDWVAALTHVFQLRTTSEGSNTVVLRKK